MHERIAIMGKVLEVMTTSGFIYNLGKGFSQWPKAPPPRGTAMNCQAAARLAKRLAEEVFNLPAPALQVISAAPAGGFVVESGVGQLAFGNTAPEIQTPQLRGYEFENHYRLRDPGAGGKVYDPTFGTSGNFNPEGIAASSKTRVINNGMGQETEYGEKYLVTRTTVFAVKILSPGPVNRKWIIDDTKFT